MRTIKFMAPVHCRIVEDGRPGSLGWFVDVEMRVAEPDDMPMVATWKTNRYYAHEGGLYTECHPYDGSWLLLSQLRVLEPDEDGEEPRLDEKTFFDYPFQPPLDLTDYGLDLEIDGEAMLHPEFLVAAEAVRREIYTRIAHDYSVLHPSRGPRVMVHRTRANRDREVEVGGAVEFSHDAGPFSAFDLPAIVAAHREVFPSVVVDEDDPYPTILCEDGWSRQQLSWMGVEDELRRLVQDMDGFADWSSLNALDRDAVVAHQRLRRVVDGGHVVELLDAVQGVVAAIDRGFCETTLERKRRWSASLKAIETIGIAPNEEAEHLVGFGL